MSDDALILVVDDDVRLRDLLGRYLTENGFRVSAAENAAAARERMRVLQPDLIVMDVMMPGLDGPAAKRLLAANDATRAIPVIFVTARQQHGEIESYKSLGVAGVIGKPFDPMTLSREIDAILRAQG